MISGHGPQVPTRLAAPLVAIVVSAAVLIVAGGPAAAQGVPSKNPAGDAAIGKKIYARDGCYECHGGGGQGSVLSGPRIAPDPIPFSAFVNYIRQPKGQMPPYTKKVMTEAELADIYAFLQSLPKPPNPKDIPILNSGTAARGK